MPKFTLALAALAGALAISSAADAKPARQFVADAIKGDNSEVALGRLAATRGRSADVRSFGNTLVRDHSQAKLAAVRAARTLRVPVPSAMMPEARAEYRRLLRLRGEAFDREFARYMVQDHRKDIREFQEQANDRNQVAADLARSTLPDLRRHLQIAESIR